MIPVGPKTAKAAVGDEGTDDFGWFYQQPGQIFARSDRFEAAYLFSWPRQAIPHTMGTGHRQPAWARMHHKVVGNFGSEADVRSLYFRGFSFNESSDNGACTHGEPAK